MNESDLSENCGMFYTLSRIGGRWKVSILAILMHHKKLRYSEIKSNLKGITERMLILHLKELQNDGLILRKDFRVVPPHVEYSLTPLGKSLEKVLIEMRAWGKRNKKKKSSTRNLTVKNTE